MTERLALFGGPAAMPARPDYAPVSSAEAAAVMRSLESVPLTTLDGGYDIDALEREFAGYVGVPHAIAVTSGTAALHTAVVAAGIGPGDEVITTAYSFVASASIIVQERAVPVFCDIEADSLGLDPTLCEALITERTKAVLAVHIYGRPAKLAALREICDRRGLVLIEDCAGSIGATEHGRQTGSVGDFGCFSFNVGKILRTGEGGMVTTRSAEAAAHAKRLRVNGIQLGAGVNDIVELGFNYTMPQCIAALGRVQLEHLPELVRRRQQNEAVLREGCATLGLGRLPDPTAAQTVGYWTPLLLPEELVPLRMRFIEAVRAEGVKMHRGYNEPLPRIEYLAPFARGRSFPVADALARRLVVVDPSPWLSTQDMETIVAAIGKVMRNLEQLR